MATFTFTTAGVANPSSGIYAAKGTSSAIPVASGGTGTGETEFSTSDYTNAGADDTSYAYATNGSGPNYMTERFAMKITGVDMTSITQLDYGTKAWGFDGYIINNVNWYIRNKATPAWELLFTWSDPAMTTLKSGTKTTSISNYIDASNCVQFLYENTSIFDHNGSSPEVKVQYLYLTVTGAASGGGGGTPRRRVGGSSGMVMGRYKKKGSVWISDKEEIKDPSNSVLLL